MDERVLDQVAERLLDALGVRVEADVAVLHLDPPTELRCATGEPIGDGREHVPGGQRLGVDREPALVGAGDEEEVRGERAQAVGLLRRRSQRVLELGAGPRMAERQLELGLEQRERRPQLVAGVGDEPPLVLEGGFEAGEHVVERLGEPLKLVFREGHWKPASGVAAEMFAALRRISSTGRSAAPARA